MAIKYFSLVRKFWLIIPIAGLFILLGHAFELHLPDIEHWVQDLGVWGPVGFIILFALLTPLFISVDALCFAAGLLFSLLQGELYMIVATYLAAALIFFMGRYFFRKKVSEFIARRKKFSDLNAIVAQKAFKLMFLLRMMPLPFALLSYSFAVAPVGFWPYLAATSGIFLYNMTLVYLGFTTKHIAGLIAGSAMSAPVSSPILVGGLLATLVVLFYISQLAAKAIDQLHKDE
jgi:uncharacterized membrane protein YdjX (TVP38/TMEM64 family)